jgi:hypothetical protein
MKRNLFVLVLIILFPAFCLDAGTPVLGMSQPQGGMRGSEFQVTFTGSRLQDAEGFIFYQPGLTLKSIDTKEEAKVVATLVVAPDAPLGIHMLRMRTATGISPIRMFAVGPFPSVNEVEPNDEFSAPQRVEMNQTIEGVLEDEGVDYFVIAAKKGQTLSVEAEGIRLGPPQNIITDPFLAIMKMDRFELATNDDNPLLRSDAFVSCVIPDDGDYIIQVRDASYEGNPNSRYRVHVGSFKRPLVCFPAGGKPGETLKVKFLQADGNFMEKDVTLPADTSKPFEVFADADGVPTPSPNYLRVFAGENVMEVEPNDDMAQTASPLVGAPCAFNGILEKPGDSDIYKITLTKDRELQFKALGKGINSPLDPVLSLHKADGAQVAANDDVSGGNLDSSFIFKAPEDGEYRLVIKDKLGYGGSSFVYRIEVADPEKAFTFSSPNFGVNDSHTRQYMAVPRGGRFATVVNFRRDRVGGDAVFDLQGLPQGVKLLKAEVPGAAGSVPLLLEAEANAPLAGTASKFLIKTTGENPFVGHYWQNFDFCRQGNGVYYERATDQLAVAVCNEVPFSLEIEKPATPLLRDGEINLKVKAQRKGEFKGNIRVLMEWKPNGISALNEIAIAADQSEGVFNLQANSGADLGSHSFTVLGEVDSGSGLIYNATPFQIVTIEEPYLRGKINLTAIEKGTGSNMVCELEQLRPFEGQAKARLIGAPTGVEVAEVTLDKNAKSITFSLKAGETAPEGKHENLFVVVDVPVNGAIATQKIAFATSLRIDKPRAPVAAAPAAPKIETPAAPPAPAPEKPLSRLEQLRLEAAQNK